MQTRLLSYGMGRCGKMTDGEWMGRGGIMVEVGETCASDMKPSSREISGEYFTAVITAE